MMEQVLIVAKDIVDNYQTKIKQDLKKMDFNFNELKI